jgi:lysozyme
MDYRTTLRAELVRDEGLKLKPYRCTANKLTIGVGRNIEDRGLTEDEAMYLLDNDITVIEKELDKAIPWWRSLSEARRRALVNMAMMGVPRLMGFKNMLAAMQAGDFDRAATEALASKWAEQVGDRSKRVAALIREG